ncbi:MAG: radical SAM protein [Alphaproteobacteria bacterium]
MELKELKAKSILHYHEQTFATNWDANIYRGCEHKCTYCFAQYSHKYLDKNEFFNDIFVKSNAPELLNKELSKEKWGKFPVNLSGVSDCYQPSEKEYKIMPNVLKAFISNKNPLVIITKSTLILRDLELIKELNKVAEVSILISVSALDETKRKLIEPNSAPTIERLKMLREFQKIGCKTAVLLMPIIPYISDDLENLEEIFRLTKLYNFDSITTHPLHLRGNTKNVFYKFLSENFPELLQKYKELFVGDKVPSLYKLSLQKKINFLKKKYQLYGVYEPSKPAKKERQLSLFSDF